LFLQQSVLLFILLFWANLVSAAKPLAEENIQGSTKVSSEEVIDLILNNPELVVIDSRYHKEYTKGHIQGAINILDTDMTDDILRNYTSDYSTPLLFYCNGERCLRSSHAVNKAIKWGYKKIYWFRKGWLEWLDKQFPVEY